MGCKLIRRLDIPGEPGSPFSAGKVEEADAVDARGGDSGEIDAQSGSSFRESRSVPHLSQLPHN